MKNILVLIVFMMTSLYSAERFSSDDELPWFPVDLQDKLKKTTFNRLAREFNAVQGHDQASLEAFLVRMINEDKNLYENDVKRFLECFGSGGFNFDFIVEGRGLTFLNYAIKTNVAPTTIALLIDHGCSACFNHQSSLFFAFKHATENRNPSTVKTLLAKGVNTKFMGRHINDLLIDYKKTFRNTAKPRDVIEFISGVEKAIADSPYTKRDNLCQLLNKRLSKSFQLPVELVNKIVDYAYPRAK
ncbi:hypothetical protein Noda2021_08590 [Candidatus Dependentiae bacterium Noda2021]|nr:hypothetical protein Noda2021_08590 [Candidatus Dependentiae bacterium Noda2021]